MMNRDEGFRFVLLLGLIGACVWPPAIPEAWRAWILPSLALVSMISLLMARTLPVRFWISIALLFGLLGLYALNPSHRWADGIGLLPVPHVPFLPRSAFPAGTRQAAALAAGLLAAGALAFQLPRRSRTLLLPLAVLGAAAMAIAVLIQRLEPRPYGIYEWTGVFVNENHFAVFANLMFPLSLALAARARFNAVRQGRVSSPSGLYGLAAVLLAAAVVMSRSRAGVAVMALLLAVHVWRHHRLVRRYPFMETPVAPVLRFLGWGAVAVAAGLAVFAFAREWNHMADVAREWNFRLGILNDTMRIWLAQPAWGTGPGSFSAVFPYYQSEMFRGRVILHAHCEPVQWLSEYGWAGVLWLAGALGLALSARPRVPDGPGRPEGEMPAFADWERPALAAGLGALGLHALVDFPLRVPLIAMLAAVWAGLWVGSRPLPAESGAGP